MSPRLWTQPGCHKTYADILTDVFFEYDGQQFAIARKPTTYRITDLDTDDGYLFRCAMTGKDGSRIDFHLTVDDIRSNVEFAEAQAETIYLPHIT